MLFAVFAIQLNCFLLLNVSRQILYYIVIFVTLCNDSSGEATVVVT